MPLCDVCNLWYGADDVHKCGGVRWIPPRMPAMQKTVVPLKPKGPDFGLLPADAVVTILSYLDERSLGFMLLLGRRWKAFAEDVLLRFVPAMIGHGSAVGHLKVEIKKYLINSRFIELAVDKFPFPSPKETDSLLGYILDNNISLNLTLGTPDTKMRDCLMKAKQSYTHVGKTEEHKKMHNKIWVIDGEGVIVGSPNVSFSGMEGGNFESCIMIKSVRVGHLFSRYLQLLRRPKPRLDPLWEEVRGSLTKYNSEVGHHLKFAFAPVMNITSFIIENLKEEGITKIIIRQYLISQSSGKESDSDILEFLCDMARKGVDVEIYIDEKAYSTMKFVPLAAKQLVAAGCKVFTQTPVTVICAHEGLQHDKLILATLHTGVVRTMIGSAGFTTDVIANNNWENFIWTDVRSVHEDLSTHHTNTLHSKIARTIRIM